MSRLDEIMVHAPDLRRFAAALCGRETIGQAAADEELVRRALQVSAKADPKPASTAKIELYRNFYRLRQKAPIRTALGPHDLSIALPSLPLAHRAALLLVTLEQFAYEDAAQVLGVNQRALVDLLLSARHMLQRHNFTSDTQLRVVS